MFLIKSQWCDVTKIWETCVKWDDSSNCRLTHAVGTASQHMVRDSGRSNLHRDLDMSLHCYTAGWHSHSHLKKKQITELLSSFCILCQDSVNVNRHKRANIRCPTNSLCILWQLMMRMKKNEVKLFSISQIWSFIFLRLLNILLHREKSWFAAQSPKQQTYYLTSWCPLNTVHAMLTNVHWVACMHCISVKQWATSFSDPRTGT